MGFVQRTTDNSRCVNSGRKLPACKQSFSTCLRRASERVVIRGEGREQGGERRANEGEQQEEKDQEEADKSMVAEGTTTVTTATERRKTERRSISEE